MADVTRRQLLGTSLGAATAGAALISGAGVIPKLLGSTAVAGVAAAGPTASDLVVHVRRDSTGEMRVMHGDGEVVLTDAQLVSRLRRAATA